VRLQAGYLAATQRWLPTKNIDPEEAYKRGEALRKRRIVMQAFADFATRPPKNNVTPMKAV
jgi:hypothetical protein